MRRQTSGGVTGQADGVAARVDRALENVHKPLGVVSHTVEGSRIRSNGADVTRRTEVSSANEEAREICNVDSVGSKKVRLREPRAGARLLVTNVTPHIFLRGGGGVSASVSGAVTASYTHVFSAEETEKYLGKVRDRKPGIYHELKVIELLQKGSNDDAKALITRNAAVGSAEQAMNMAEGDDITLSAQGQIAGGLALL